MAGNVEGRLEAPQHPAAPCPPGSSSHGSFPPRDSSLPPFRAVGLLGAGAGEGAGKLLMGSFIHSFLGPGLTSCPRGPEGLTPQPNAAAHPQTEPYSHCGPGYQRPPSCGSCLHPSSSAAPRWHQWLTRAQNQPPQEAPPGLPASLASLASPRIQEPRAWGQEVMEGRTDPSNRSGQSALPQAEPSGQLCQAGASCLPQRGPGNGVKAPSPKGFSTTGTGLTPGLVKRAKPGVGLECSTSSGLAEGQGWCVPAGAGLASEPASAKGSAPDPRSEVVWSLDLLPPP